MLKTLRLPICGLLSVAMLLAAAPRSQAAFSSSLYHSLLKKIYSHSDEGDGGDIFVIIKKALQANPNEGDDLVKKLIATLEDNLDQLDDGVDKDDLKRIAKRLKKYLKQHQAVQTNHGNVSSPESPT